MENKTTSNLSAGKGNFLATDLAKFLGADFWLPKKAVCKVLVV